MALTGGARWKPDATTGSLETKVEWRDKSAGDGRIVMVAQLVAYDDQSFNAQNTYRPGHPDSERNLIILDQDPKHIELTALASMTQAEKDAAWAAELQAFWDSYPNAVKIALATSMWAAKRAAPITAGG